MQLIYGIRCGGAEITPRVKLFARRACLEALTTRSGLNHRVLTMGAACGLCGEAEESGLHALAKCGLVRGVWEV